MSQNRLREFVNNSGVQVQRGNGNNSGSNYSVSSFGSNNNNNVNNRAAKSNSESNAIVGNDNNRAANFNLESINYNAIVGNTPLRFTPLKYTNFNATIKYSAIPNNSKNVLQFVKNTKPRNGDFVEKISAIHGRMQRGAWHTRQHGFKLQMNANTANNIKWHAIIFELIHKNDGGKVVVTFYKDSIQMNGSMTVDPLNIAKYIVKTYFKKDPEFVNDIEYYKIDASFAFNATFTVSNVLRFLASKGIYPFYSENRPFEIKDIKYKDIEINTIVNSGFVRLHNAKSKNQMERMYALAKEFIQILNNNNLLTITNSAPQNKRKRKRSNANVTTPEKIRQARVPRASGAIPVLTRSRNSSQILVNGLVCNDLKIDYIKELSKRLGVKGEKGWKKEDYCKAMYKKAKNLENEKVQNVQNIGKSNRMVTNYLYKKKEVNNDSIRTIVGNRGIQYVRTSKLIKYDRRGIPTKTSVTKVANVVNAAQTELNRFRNINANTRKIILNKVKNVKNTTKAVTNMVRQHVRRVQIRGLTTKLTANEKNKIYEDLKNKRNVNVNSYARKYKLIKNYNTTNNVKNKVINWMKNKTNALPTNENIMNKLRSSER